MKNLVLAAALLATPAFAASTVNVNAEKSSVLWHATKVTGEHSGAVKIKSGSLTFDGKKLTGGEFVADMTSISVSDIPADDAGNGKLVNHLKSDDFFSVDKNPEAKFVVKSVAPGKGAGVYDVTGDLTIKGITNSVTVPATVKEAAGAYTADAKLKLDRTKWDIRYGSKNFFPDLVANKVIHNEFELTVSLQTAAPAPAKAVKKHK